MTTQNNRQDPFVQDCMKLAQGHYENFPVASFLLPRHLRAPIAVIYAFARTADDFADEGDLPDQERLGKLDSYAHALKQLENGQHPKDPLFVALKQIIQKHNLPFDPFYRLLKAFKQDVIQKRYQSFQEIMDYCHNSANPVGYLLIHLYHRVNDINVENSNLVCSSLQIINFLQDISVDWKKDRVYLPQDEMRAAGIEEGYIEQRRFDQHWSRFLDIQLDRVESMIKRGSALSAQLPLRARLELRMTVEGGLRIIRKLRRQNRHQFIRRPRLTPWDWLIMATRSILYSYR